MRGEGEKVLQGELVNKVLECLISPLLFTPFDLGREVRWACGTVIQENYQDKTHLVYSTVMLCEVLINNTEVTIPVMRFTISSQTHTIPWCELISQPEMS